jgi:hypothetical protein
MVDRAPAPEALTRKKPHEAHNRRIAAPTFANDYAALLMVQ